MSRQTVVVERQAGGDDAALQPLERKLGSLGMGGEGGQFEIEIVTQGREAVRQPRGSLGLLDGVVNALLQCLLAEVLAGRGRTASGTALEPPGQG